MSRLQTLGALATIFAAWCAAGYIDASVERDQEFVRIQARLARCEAAKIPTEPQD